MANYNNKKEDLLVILEEKRQKINGKLNWMVSTKGEAAHLESHFGDSYGNQKCWVVQVVKDLKEQVQFEVDPPKLNLGLV